MKEASNREDVGNIHSSDLFGIQGRGRRRERRQTHPSLQILMTKKKKNRVETLRTEHRTFLLNIGPQSHINARGAKSKTAGSPDGYGVQRKV